MTGGVVPPGADTIVMQEHVKAAQDRVTIGPGHKKGQNLRRAGEDLLVGQVALKRGLLLRPAEVGLISSLGIGEVTVYRRLRVAFFSTGDELVSIGTQPKEGQIFVVGVTAFLRGCGVPRDLSDADRLYGGDEDVMSRGNTTIVAARLTPDAATRTDRASRAPD